MRTDWSTIECQETFEFCPFVDVSFSSRRNHRAWDACRVFKADVLRESKHSAWFLSSEIDDRSWPLSVIVRVLRGRVRLGKREKIGRRRRIHTEKTKTITIIDRRIRIHTCMSRRVKVKSTFGGPPCMRRSSASTYGSSAGRHSADLLAVWGPSIQLGWSTVLPLAVGSWATIQGPCAMHAQTTALVDGEASARRSKKTFGPHGRAPAYGKDSTKRRQLWGSFRRFG